MKNIYFLLIGLIFLLFGVSHLTSFTSLDLSTIKNPNFQSDSLKKYSVYALKIPPTLAFANENVPIKRQQVKEKFDKELLINTYWQSQTLLFFKRANKWFPLIEPILEEYKIPSDFKYITLVESGLTNIVSPAGATGFWQLMKPTALELGLEINENIDERYNVFKSTHAACKYLVKAYKLLGDWTLAAAAFNCGINCIEKQIDEQQQNNFYDLSLNSETTRYIYRILAIKEILLHPAHYGFQFQKIDLYEQPIYKKLTVDSPIQDLIAFSKANNITYQAFQELNPWIRSARLPNQDGKRYTFLIPANNY